jgi:hypothetical protein
VTRNNTGGVDENYLRFLGYDGILPETSFVIIEPIPIWPLVAFASVAIISFLIGIYYHLESRPEEAPRIRSVLIRARKILLRYMHRLRHPMTKSKR